MSADRPVGVLLQAKVALEAWRAGRISRGDPAVAARLQGERLASLLRDVTAGSDYFREKYRGHGLGPSTFGSLPTMTKAEWRREFDRAVLDPAVTRAGIFRHTDDLGNLGRLFLGKYAVFHTSGSQGESLPVVYDQGSMVALLATSMARGNAEGRAGLGEGLRRILSPFRLATVTMARGFYPSGAASEFYEGMAGAFLRVLRLAADQPDLAARLAEFRPQGLVSYPSTLARLADRAPELGLRGRLVQVTSTGEPLSPAVRRHVETAFGVPVLDHYGAGECLFLAEGCRTGPGFHVNTDWTVLEVVDEDGRPAAPGRPGAKVLVTNLANRVQPFIRYEVPDQVVIAEAPCGCGNRLVRIDRVAGRVGERIEIRTEAGSYDLTTHPFGATLEVMDAVLTWQVVQTGPGGVEVRWTRTPGAGSEGVEARIRSELARYGVPSWLEVRIRRVESIPPDPRTGKVPRLVGGPASTDVGMGARGIEPRTYSV